ncbi:hypothetical protein BsWGS_28055 [Bradybaena similaris]
MEFLKGLEKALAVGLTKEQFIDIWNTESKVARDFPPNSTSLISNGPQVKDIEDRAATVVDHNAHASSSDFQSLEECSRSCLSDLGHTCNQLVHKQEQQWQQLQHKHVQMMEEVRSGFSLLSAHIGNVVDCNTNSMKVYIMQELGLLEQELPQMIQELKANHGSDRSKASTVNRELRTKHGPVTDRSKISTEIQELTSAKVSGCRISEASSREDALEADGQSEYSKPQELLENVHRQIYPADLEAYQQHKVHNGILMSIDGLEKGEKNITPPEDVKYIKEKVDSKTNMAIDDDVYRNTHKTPLTISGCNFKSNQCKKAESAETKVSNVQASQGKQSSPLSMSAPGSVNLHGSRSSLNSSTDNTDTPTQSVPTDKIGALNIALHTRSSSHDGSHKRSLSLDHYSQGCQMFTVTVSPRNGVFHSPAMCSSGVACLATFQGHFDAKGALNIALHIKRSSYDDSHKWPLFLSGTGYLFHRVSKRYTPVWQVAPTTCQKPLSASGAYAFSCAVCLTTSLDRYPNVTYKQLVSSGFIKNKTLNVKCTLSASTSASTNATSASTSAPSASTSAPNASTSATSVSTSATSASTSAPNASTSATSTSRSATSTSRSATNASTNATS